MIEIYVRGPLCRSRSFVCGKGRDFVMDERGGGGNGAWYADTEAP